MFAAGGCVNGGVYNCDEATWGSNSGVMFEKSGRYLSRRTDYRAVFGEIFTNYFGDDSTQLTGIIPGYEAAAAANPGDFSPLNFVRTS